MAMAQTIISEMTIRIPNKSLIGKSNKKPASAIGVQRTKKLDVSRDAMPPVNKSYLNVK